MNKILKIILILLNLIMLLIAIRWYADKKELEPSIAIFGQISSLFVLFFEKKAAKIITKKLRNQSDVDVEAKDGDEVTTSDIDNSKVRIKVK